MSSETSPHAASEPNAPPTIEYNSFPHPATFESRVTGERLTRIPPRCLCRRPVGDMDKGAQTYGGCSCILIVLVGLILIAVVVAFAVPYLVEAARR